MFTHSDHYSINSILFLHTSSVYFLGIVICAYTGGSHMMSSSHTFSKYLGGRKYTGEETPAVADSRQLAVYPMPLMFFAHAYVTYMCITV